MSRYLVSIPKSCTNVPQHRKVAVTEDQDGPKCDLQDTLLALNCEPKDLLALVVTPPMERLMHLERNWDVFEETFNTYPDIFDSSDEPEAKLCHALLVNKIMPMSLADRKEVGFINSLLTMQREWAQIKETSSPAPLICDFCGGSGPLLRCSGCMQVRKEVRYCNKECQHAGWKKHKKAGCGRYASEESKDRVKQAINGAKK
jgi:hypothetical protein